MMMVVVTLKGVVRFFIASLLRLELSPICLKGHRTTILMLCLKARTPSRAPTPNPRADARNTSSNEQPPGTALASLASFSVGSEPLKQARHCPESTRYEDRSKVENTDLQKFRRRGKTVSSRNPYQHGATISYPNSQVGEPLSYTTQSATGVLR